MKMSNKVYDILKWVAILFLPALAQLIKGVFALWGIPYGEQIADTIMYLHIFLGAILGISHIQYKKNAESTDNLDSSES